MINKLKRILPVVLAFTMLCGSSMSVFAFEKSSRQASLLSKGGELEVGYVSKTNTKSYHPQREIIRLSSASEPVYVFSFAGDIQGFATPSISNGTMLLSKASFNGSYDRSNNLTSITPDDVEVFENTKFDFSSLDTSYQTLNFNSDGNLTYNGTTYYYKILGSSSTYSGTCIVQTTLAYFPLNEFAEKGYLKDPNVGGPFFEHLYATDFIDPDIKDDGSNGLTFDFIMTNGKFKSSLGYLENLKYKVRIGTKTSEMSHVVTWDNTHEDWDDSYRVAHYIQFTNRADTDPTLNKDHIDDAITSELILMNDVKYSDCSSTYFIHGDKYQEESKKFKEYLESQLPFWEKDMAVFGSDQYLIIYRETENGTEYGYWNILRTATSTGAAPEHEYGTMDDDGNFIEKENLGKVDTEVGRGDTLEDAEKEENNVKYDKDHDLDQTPTLDKASDLFEYFFELMDSLYNTIGDLPKVVGNLFTFLPAEMLALLSLGLLIAIILRIVGR